MLPTNLEFLISQESNQPESRKKVKIWKKWLMEPCNIYKKQKSITKRGS